MYKEQEKDEENILDMKKKENRKGKIFRRKKKVQSSYRRSTKGKESERRGGVEEYEKRSRSMEIY